MSDSSITDATLIESQPPVETLDSATYVTDIPVITETSAVSVDPITEEGPIITTSYIPETPVVTEDPITEDVPEITATSYIPDTPSVTVDPITEEGPVITATPDGPFITEDPITEEFPPITVTSFIPDTPSITAELPPITESSYIPETSFSLEEMPTFTESPLVSDTPAPTVQEDIPITSAEANLLARDETTYSSQAHSIYFSQSQVSPVLSSYTYQPAVTQDIASMSSYPVLPSETTAGPLSSFTYIPVRRADATSSTTFTGAAPTLGGSPFAHTQSGMVMGVLVLGAILSSLNLI